MGASNHSPTHFRWHDSLLVRILGLCVILMCCLMGAVYFLTGHYYQQVVQSMEHQAQDIASRVKVQLDERLEIGAELEDIPEDFVSTSDDTPVGLKLVPEGDAPNTITPQVGEEGYFFIATQTFQLSSGEWVELTVRLDIDPQTEVVRAFKNRYLFTLTAVFLATLAVIVYLIAGALRPLRELSNTCAKISEGNLSNVSVRGSASEIRLLEETFNRMVDSLKEKEVVEANLRQAQRLSAIGNLAAGVAHDVRNPLNAIKLLSSHALDALAQPGNGGAPVKELETIRSEVERLEEIVSGFLSLAKEEELHKEESSIDALLEECLNLVKQEAEIRNVRLTSELRAGDMKLLIDPKHIVRAVLNVLINALEACPENGRVRLFSRATQDGCEIEIRDDGPGMPEDVLEQAFDPYFTTKATGTGLGLSITRGIIEEHGGAISVSSSNEQGCQALIVLPLPQQAEAP